MSSVLWIAAAAAPPAPAITAEHALENARALYSVERQRTRRCPEPRPGEILVCRELEDPDELRVPSDTDLGDPDDGMVRAPNVSPLPDCATASFCARVGRKPPDPLIIDLKSIPEAPPGSDADRIAKGEMAAP